MTRGDEKYINKFPDDAAEIASLVRQGDLGIAIKLLQVWGAKQRDIGGIAAIERTKASLARAVPA